MLVAAKSLDGVTDGLHLFPCNVLLFVLCAPKFTGL
jgi:hypothetical protein